MADQEGRAVLAVQHLPQPDDVIRERGFRELECRDGEAAGLQALDDGAPARAVGPRAVHQDNIRSSGHLRVPLLAPGQK
jgi:hypothetical protein